MIHRGRPSTYATTSSTAVTYVMDDEATMLSMRNFRQQPKPPSLWRKLGGGTALLMALLGLVIGFIMGFDQAASHASPKETSQAIIVTTESSNGAIVRYNSMTSPIELLGLVRKTRMSLVQKLRDEYGDEYANILMEKSNLDNIFHLTPASKIRYQRRMIQKILHKQLKPKEKVRFTWVTAGDVHAAGFGNDPGHSYTSMLDDTVSEAFSAVGLEFVAKNHGLFNIPSAPAVALCMTTIYGKEDIDVLSWDFSLADGDFRYRAALFAMRATMHPSRPLLFMMDSKLDERWKKYFWVEGKVGVGMMDTASLQEMVIRHFPDSSRLPHPEQLPPALAYLQCNGAVEGQCHQPGTRKQCNVNDMELDKRGLACREHKFLVTDSCDMHKYQSDWNVGWKDHRLKGRLLGLFMIQLLQDALLELDEAASQQNSRVSLAERREELLKQYQQYDGQDNFVMSNSIVSSNIVGRYAERMSELTIPLFQRPSTCLLPASFHVEEARGGHEMVMAPKGGGGGNKRVRRRLQAEPPQEPATEGDGKSAAAAEPNIVAESEVIVADAGAGAKPVNATPPAPAVEPETQQPEAQQPEAHKADSEETSAGAVGAAGAAGAAAESHVVVADAAADGDKPANTTSVVVSEPTATAETVVNVGSATELATGEAPAGEGAKAEPVAGETITGVEASAAGPESQVVVAGAPAVGASETEEVAPKAESDSQVVVAGATAEGASETEKAEPKAESDSQVVVAGVTAVSASETEETAPKVESNSQVVVAGATAVDVSSTEEEAAKAESEPASSVGQVETPDSVPPAVGSGAGESEVIVADAASTAVKPIDEIPVMNANTELDPSATQAPQVVVQEDTAANVTTAVTSVEKGIVPEDTGVSAEGDGGQKDVVEEAPLKAKPMPHCPLVGLPKKDSLAEIKGGTDGYAVEIDNSDDAFLVLCFRSCTTGNCIRAMDGLDSVKIADGNIVVEVDGIPVIGSREIDSCHFLEGEEYGFLWKSKHDKFRIRIRMKEEGGDLFLYAVLAL